MGAAWAFTAVGEAAVQGQAVVEYGVAGAGVDGVNRAGGGEAVHLKQASSVGFGIEA